MFINVYSKKFARILILAFVALSSLIFLTNCNSQNLVVTEICEITDEICFYATSICDLYSADSTKFKNSNILFKNLNSSLDRLKQIDSFLSQSTNKKASLTYSDLLNELILIRNDLKDLLPNKSD